MQWRRKYLVYLFSLMIFSVSLEAQTNYSALYTSGNFVKTIDLSRPVGTVAASPGVTPTGGVTYSIPIYTPPGTNGMEPSVSIVYNSQGSASIVGFGWSISGLSVISRTGKNIYHNGVASPVTYTAGDAFLLDGMRLNAINGANGANGTVYAGESEAFSTITSNTSSSPNNPDWFLVTSKEGSKMEFGNTADSRVMTDDGQNVMLWRLNKVIDINGNYIAFKYDNTSRDIRIDEINYTGNINTGLIPYNKIKFNYGYRYETNTAYDGGASLISLYLLNSIVITQIGDDGAPLFGFTKKYQFNYGFDNMHSLLKEVVESGTGDNDNEVLLNSTIFLYGDPPANMAVEETVEFTGECLTGDFNADGKSDIMASDHYYDNNIKYCSGYKLLLDPHSSTPFYYKPLTPGHTIIEDRKLVNFLAGDFSGDGRDDIVLVKTRVVNQGLGLHRYFDSVSIAYSTNTGYTQSYLPVNRDGQISVYGNFIISGDFDGDGSQDYIVLIDNWAAFTSPAKNIINYTIATNGVNVATVQEAKKVIAMDFDGDGKQEIWVTNGSLSYILSVSPQGGGLPFYQWDPILSSIAVGENYKLYPGDFNGDRKTDLLVREGPSGSWKTYLSTGKNFIISPFSFYQTVNISEPEQYSDDKLIVTDFNGDGLSDILHGFRVWNGGISTSSKFSLYYSKGYYASVAFLYEQYDYNKTLPFTYTYLPTGDFNGDGRCDLLIKGYSPYSSGDIVYFKLNGKERLLMKVTDGHNVTTSFEYKNITDKSSTPYVYNRTISLDDPANQNPFNYVQVPMQVVSSMSEPDGVGGTNSTSFYYEDAVLHRHAKGFLGFKKVTGVNTNSGITSITDNQINTQFVVPYNTKQTTKLTATNEVLSETNITNLFVNLSTGSHDTRYFHKVDKTLAIDYLSGRANESVNTFDNYGNIITNVLKIGVPSGSTVNPTETTTTTTVFGIHNTPVPAKPDNIAVSNTRTNMPSISATSTFTYTANGLPATQTAFYGLPKSVTTSYTYNSFGNATQIIKSASGVSNRTTAATYDIKGRYPITKQAIGSTVTQTESLTYNIRWGQPLSKTSSDCLTTTLEYDAFGRLKKTNMPEGYSIIHAFVWDVQGQQVFYSFVDFPGGKPDTKTWVDKLGRKIKSQTAGFNNQWLTELTTYDNKGNISTKTNACYPGETPLLTTTTYDVYNRPVSVSNTLNTITSTYTQLGNGLVQVTTQNSAGQSASKITDASGKTVTAIDNGGQLDFTYDSRGNQTETKHASTVLETITYDVYGRQTSLTDKNTGTVSYDYDAFGQLVQQTDALNNLYTMAYDDLGRIVSRQGPEGITTYEYYKTNKFGTCNNNNLSKVTGFGGVVKEYTYDNLRRLQTEKLTINAFIGGQFFITQYNYDIYGNITNTTYPSGVVVNNFYDANGGLSSVTGGDSWNPVTLFTANAVNGFGQYTNYTLGNGKTSQNTYNYGIPTRFYTQGVQDLNFTFNLNNGNLTSRYDAIKGLTEFFQYDNLNRLTNTAVGSVQQLSINYDGNSSFSMGNITSKTDAGNYVYYNGANGINKIHAVAYITNPAGPTEPPVTQLPSPLQQITYTPFLKAASLTDGVVQTNFLYDPDYQRVKSDIYVSGSLNTTKYYFGNFERVISGSYTRDIHYIPVGNSLAIIETPLYSSSIIHFVYTDYLGSLLTKTDINGNITAEQNFDAWGRLRDPNNWQYLSYISGSFFDRGYTAHEHMPYHALINMNGRIYDPVQGRMLSPDNDVANPWQTQSYNRYSYANNNPLVYRDPDGNNPVVVAVIIGAIVGAYSGGVTANNGQLNPFKWNSSKTWSYVIGGAIIGAASGYIGGAVAASAMPFSNTAGIVSASFFNSIGMNMLTGGQVPVSVGFGAGSYSFQSGDMGYLWEKGNSFLTNLGYGFGAMANVQDIVAGFNGTHVDVNAHVAKDDLTGHSAVYNLGTDPQGRPIKINISVMRNGSTPGSKSGFLREFEYVKNNLELSPGTHYTGYPTSGLNIRLFNVNRGILERMTENLRNGYNLSGRGALQYGGLMYGCMGTTTRALWAVGVLTLPNIHPLTLSAQLFIRQAGIFASPYLINSNRW